MYTSYEKLSVVKCNETNVFLLSLSPSDSLLGPKAVEAYGKKFEVKTVSGKLLFSADDNEVVVGAERLRVLGKEILII